MCLYHKRKKDVVFDKSFHRASQPIALLNKNLKEPVYRTMIKDRDNHQAIFNSLLYSAYDLYGQIDRKKAGRILSRERRRNNFPFCHSVGNRSGGRFLHM